MTDPVENDLRDGAFAVHVLIAGLVVDGAGEAVERLGARGVAAPEDKGPSGWVRAALQRDLRVHLERLLRRDLLKDQRRRGRGRCMRRGGGCRVGNGEAADRDRADEAEHAKPDRSARMGADERARLLPPVKCGDAQAVERLRKGQCFSH